MDRMDKERSSAPQCRARQAAMPRSGWRAKVLSSVSRRAEAQAAAGRSEDTCAWPAEQPKGLGLHHPWSAPS